MKCKHLCCGFVLFLIAVTCLCLYIILPHRSGDIQLDYGFGSSVVYYEDNGVPHIYADNKEIAAFTLGYLNAADRLWQIEYLRKLSQGRLSEVFGKVAYKLDEAMRIVGLHHTCDLTREYFTSQEAFDYYDYFAKGINEYVKRNPLPIQFQLFWINFEPWTLSDTCSIVKFVHFVLSHNWSFELSRDFIDSLTDDQELINLLFPYQSEFFHNYSTFVINDDELKKSKRYVNNTDDEEPINSREADIATYAIKQAKNIHEQINQSLKVQGSNSWVISGKHTKSGKPILSDDTHLSNGVPSLWYVSHITYPDGTYMFGCTVPGFPIHVFMATDKIAIGGTNLFVDNSDLYEEKVVNDTYLFNNEYYPLKIREETIKIKGEADHVFQVKSTRNGPLIQKRYYLFNIINDNNLPLRIRNGYFSLKSTVFYDVKNTPKQYEPGTLNDGYSVFEVFYKAAFSKSVPEVIRTLREMTGLHQALNIADADGNIGFLAVGSYPKRKQKKNGNTISAGWTDENDWIGLVQPREKPYIINPEKGFIVHANGPVSSENVKIPVAVHVPSSARAFRITELIEKLIQEKSGNIEYQDMINILNDSKDIFVENKVENLVTIVTNYFEQNKENYTDVIETINNLRNWNSSFELYIDEPTYFTVWEYHIMNNIITEQITDNTLKMKILSLIQSNSFMLKLYENVANDPNYNPKFCTQFNGEKVSSCAELISKALLHAVNHLKPFKARGKARWRTFHKSLYPNIPFSQTALKSIYERLVPLGGSCNSIKMCCFDYWDFEDNRFNCKVSANNKIIVEFGVNIAPKSSNETIIGNEIHYSIESGISENVFSSYYFNMNKRHIKNDLYTLSSYLEKEEKYKSEPSLIIRGKYGLNYTESHVDL